MTVKVKVKNVFCEASASMVKKEAKGQAKGQGCDDCGGVCVCPLRRGFDLEADLKKGRNEVSLWLLLGGYDHTPRASRARENR